MQMNISGNKREFFRVNLKIPVFIKKIFYDSKNNRYYTNNWVCLKSKNISGNGIFVFKDKENSIDFKKDDYVLLKYDLTSSGEFIYIIAKMVRKDDDGYAFTYILFDENKIDRIIGHFLKITNEKQ